jgi:hypothetical protein
LHRFSSQCLQKQSDLPDDRDAGLPMKCEPITAPRTVTSENSGKMVEYWQADSEGLTSLIQRKAITEYYFLNNKNKKHALQRALSPAPALRF